MKIKRIMAMVLCFAMVLSTMSFSVFAEGEAVEVSTLEQLQEALAADNDLPIVITDMIEISADETVELDLNGKAITGKDDATASFGLINIQPGAELTISDNVGTGKITLTAINNRGWNAYSSVISNQRGKLTVNAGTIEHLGGTDMAYAIDNLTNGKGTCAETIINGGTIKSTYRAVRQFLNGLEAKNILKVNGGTIEGANKSIWFQNANSSNNPGALTVSENAALKGDVLLSGSNVTEWTASVAVASAALCDGATVTLNKAEGYDVAENNGNYGVVVDPAYGKVAQIGENYYTTLADALEATKTMSGEVVIDLCADAELSYGAREAYGNENITSITINGNDNTLTFNQTNSDWSSIGMKNADGVFKMNNVTVEKIGYGDTSGAWNTHAINFNVNTEFKDVTFNNSIKVSGESILTNVDVVEAGGYYGIWIPADATSVTINGGSITATNGGRGIKIADQYVDAPAQVKLTVDGMTFETAKKAAVLVSSIAGADITAANCDISKVADDSQNFAWIDDGKNDAGEKYTDYAEKVKVNDEAAFTEGTIATVNGVTVADVATAFAQAVDGDEVVIYAAGTYSVPTGKDITITGAAKGVKFDMSNAVGINASMTFTNVTFEYGNANYKGLQHAGDMVYNDCTINGQVSLYGTSETFNNCTFNQTSSDAYNVWTYGAKKVAFNECTFNSAGKSVLIYSEQADLVNDVTVTKTTFNASTPVDGKAAIEMDSSLTSGINLTIDGETTATGFAAGNISGNNLWNNKKGNTGANNDISVVVNDETVLEPKFAAKIGEIKYETIAEAINAAQVGETVTILAGTYAVPSVKAGITIEGEGEVLLEGTLSGTLENLTLTNLHIKGSNAQRWAYAKGNLVFENVTFEATSVYALHFDGISADTNLTYKNCTIIGWAAMGGSPASCVFDGCTIKGNGAYGVIRTYFDAEMKNCTFDVANVNKEDGYQDGIHSVGATIKVNNCTNANGDIEDILNVSVDGEERAYIYVDGELVRSAGKKQNVSTEAELKNAINEALVGDTITLLNDIKITDKLIIDKEVTIDGNGHSIIADETAVWYTVSGKLNLKNYKTHLIGVNSQNVTLKNIVLDNNNNAAGINIYCAQNVVFDNVSIINATKGMAALTVNGSTLTIKNQFKALGNSIAVDISNGSGVTSDLGVTVEEGTVFDLADKTVKFASVARNDVSGAVNSEGKPYFVAMDSGYYYSENQINNRTTAFSNGLTLLADAELTKAINVKGTFDLNRNTLYGAILVPKGNITVKNGSIVNENASVSAIEINEGTLNLSNVNIASARHAVRIDGAVTAVIDGGEYKLTATSGTRHAVNVSGAANVTIKDGTFVGPKGTTMDSGSAVCVQSGATVTIDGGNFVGGKNATLGVSGTLTVFGGLFDQDPSQYVAEGYCAALNKDGMYCVVAEREITISAAPARVEAGQEVTLSVTLNGDDLANAKWTIDYDKNVFALQNGNDTGKIDDKVWKEDTSVYASGEIVAEYTFKVLPQAEATTSDFIISNTYAYTHQESYDGIKIAADNNGKVTVEIALIDYTVITKLNDNEVTDAEAEVEFNKDGHTFAVEGAPEGSTVVYTVNGEEKENVAITEVGEHTIAYTVTGPKGYKTKTGELKLTIKEPVYFVEVVKNYIPGKDLVLVHTETDGVYFTYNKELMVDVSANKAYEFEGKKYAKIFAFVTATIENGTDEAYKALVKPVYSGDVFKIAEYTADINFDAEEDIRDITSVYGVYNVNSILFSNISYQKLLLRADNDGDKKVDNEDVTWVINTIYPVEESAE